MIPTVQIFSINRKTFLLLYQICTFVLEFSWHGQNGLETKTLLCKSLLLRTGFHFWVHSSFFQLLVLNIWLQQNFRFPWSILSSRCKPKKWTLFTQVEPKKTELCSELRSKKNAVTGKDSFSGVFGRRRYHLKQQVNSTHQHLHSFHVFVLDI